ncbi:MAG: alpha/beta fold hydrolase [Acidimicrobiales bacterium]
MGLAKETTGVGQRFVLAHGFTQNRHCWGPFGDQVAVDHELVMVDMPGHGNTDPNHDSADLSTSADLLIESGGEAIYVGYSMGGRVALHAALRHPAAVRGLVLIGATAGIDDAADRRDRRLADDALADELIEIGLDAFLDRWLAGPLFASLSDAAACRDARRSNRVDGLAASLRRCGTGTQEPLWDRLGAITAPVLVLAGANDAKFTALGGRLVDAMANAQLKTIPGNHAVHLEAPTPTAAAVRSFASTLS